jgi:hypothetical protein
MVTFFLFAFVVIPPLTGRVVDAITGKPIPNIRLTLQISTYKGWSVHSEAHATTTTGASGWFFLPGAHRQQGPLISHFRSYWLTVNQGSQGPGLSEGSAENQVLFNPMSNRRGEPTGNRRYFPLTLTFDRRQCDRDRIWPATCRYEPFWRGLSVPPIPVLDDPTECNKIKDPHLRENCRQLNAYRAAFVHADTYQEVQRDKTLCAEVDHARLSATCVSQLGVYAVNPFAYGRPATRPPNMPLPEGMFVDHIGNAVRFRQGCGPRDIFTGIFSCSAAYGPKDSVWWVGVTVNEWPSLESKVVAQILDDRYYHIVARPDGKIMVYQWSDESSARWVSKNNVVNLLFYHRIPEQEGFIAHYLAEFPSTLQ